MDLMQFVGEQFIWLVPCLIVFGMILKNIPKFPDWCIPISLLIVGILVAAFFGNWTKESFIQGIICGLASTGLHQLVKQPIQKR